MPTKIFENAKAACHVEGGHPIRCTGTFDVAKEDWNEYPGPPGDTDPPSGNAITWAQNEAAAGMLAKSGAPCQCCYDASSTAMSCLCKESPNTLA